MSKELTEQWQNGTLDCGWYFLEFENGSTLPVYYCGFNREFEFGWDWKISKVLAPVPAYQEHLESEAHCAVYSEINEQNKEKIEQLESKLSCISEQLKEANEVIKHYADGTIYLFPTWYNGSFEAYDYLEKWGVE